MVLQATVFALPVHVECAPLVAGSPHIPGRRAAVQGVWCRLWQVASLCVGVGMLAVLRQLAPGKALLPEQVNFTFVPQGSKLH